MAVSVQDANCIAWGYARGAPHGDDIPRRGGAPRQVRRGVPRVPGAIQTKPDQGVVKVDRDVDGVGGKPFLGDLERRPRARARLVEQVDHRLAAQCGHLLDRPGRDLLERIRGVEDRADARAARRPASLSRDPTRR